MAASGLTGKRFVGKTLKELDPDGRGRYYVNIPELQPHMPESKGILCTNSTTGSRVTNSDKGTYGTGSTPLQAGTLVQVEFYSDDINSARITAIVSDDQPKSDMSPGRVMNVEPSGKVIAVAVNGLPETITEISKSAQNVIGQLLNSGNAIAQALLGSIAGTIGSVFNEIASGFQALAGGALAQVQNIIKDNLPKLEALTNIKDSIGKALSNINIGETLKGALDVSKLNLESVAGFIKENSSVLLAVGEGALTAIAASQSAMEALGNVSQGTSKKMEELQELQKKENPTFEDLEKIKSTIEETQKDIDEMIKHADEAQKNLDDVKKNVEENKDKLSPEEYQQLKLQMETSQQDIDGMRETIKQSQESLNKFKKQIEPELNKLYGNNQPVLTAENDINNNQNPSVASMEFMPMMISESGDNPVFSGEENQPMPIDLKSSVMSALGSFGGVQIPQISLSVFDEKAAIAQFEQLSKQAQSMMKMPAGMLESAMGNIGKSICKGKAAGDMINIKDALSSISDPVQYTSAINGIKEQMMNMIPPGLSDKANELIGIATGTMNQAKFIAEKSAQWGKENATKIQNIFTNVKDKAESQISSRSRMISLAAGGSSGGGGSSRGFDESGKPPTSNFAYGNSTAQGDERDKRHMLLKTPNDTGIYVNEDTKNDPNSLYIVYAGKQTTLRFDSSGIHISTENNFRQRITVNRDIEINGTSSIKVTGGKYDIKVIGDVQIESSGETRVFAEQNINLRSSKNISICAEEMVAIEGKQGVIVDSTTGSIYIGSQSKDIYEYANKAITLFSNKSVDLNGQNGINLKGNTVINGDANSINLNSGNSSTAGACPLNWKDFNRANPANRGVCTI